MIQLFQHNQEAYESMVSLLARERKAAIIHPTGSGKSFIGFKLCEENPDRRVCWLSPSEYIYRTQIDNLEGAGGKKPDNVVFYTYAKLALLDNSELKSIAPDYIILDEFHRCGAQVWGKGVHALLSEYREAMVVGLSATHIRYLDNQRDMADELFDGNVASEITLGEAIVRGILPEPKYVTALFSYQEQLMKYATKVKKQKNSFVRNQAEELLEKLRRSLEKAERLDEIFSKHMKRSGKYVIFCSNKAHLDEMVKQSKQWFHHVDIDPHIYTMYSEDAEANHNFQAFKEDKSAHLKLLFTIDILNEGVHLSGVSGVILLRPTVSPIIYKQQIGRALSATNSGSPVIFDIVNNFENLYSVGAIKSEMNEAVVYYHDKGEQEAVVTESFEILEEMKECRQLFQTLEESLVISWEEMYRSAKAYYNRHGDLYVKARYKTPEGYALGQWIRNQRYIRKGEIYGSLDETQIQKLDMIGMCWENAAETLWNKNFQMVQQYFIEHGDSNLGIAHIIEGVHIGEWLAAQRQQYRNHTLAPWKIEQLESMAFVWNPMEENWNARYETLHIFMKENGRLPKNTEEPSLCAWMRLQKNNHQDNQLSLHRIKLLEELGIDLNTSHSDQAWNQQAEALFSYIKEHHRMPMKSEKLGLWLGKELQRERQGRLLTYRKARLEEIGVVFGNRKDRAFKENIEMLKAFITENNRYPSTYDKYNGFSIGTWCTRIRKEYAKGELEEAYIKLLQEADFDFRSSKVIRDEEQWQLQSQQLHTFVCEHGRLPKFRENQRLALWYKEQREKVEEDGMDEKKVRWVMVIEEMLGE